MASEDKHADEDAWDEPDASESKDGSAEAESKDGGDEDPADVKVRYPPRARPRPALSRPCSFTRPQRACSSQPASQVPGDSLCTSAAAAAIAAAAAAAAIATATATVTTAR
jgi:hypothetical protein